MTEEQKKFFEMITGYRFERISRHWNKKTCSLDIENLKEDIKLMSNGERHLAQFFASVWLGESNTFPFDVIQTARTLDNSSRRVITEWLKEPFFP